MEIWFNTSQRLADQASMILMEGWFSYLKIIEICRQVSREKYSQEPSTQIERQNIEKTTYHRTHHHNTIVKTNRKKQRLYKEIRTEKKITLQPLRNQKWKNS